METVADRIWKVKDYKGLKIGEYSRILEVSTQYFYDLRSGKLQSPSASVLNKFKTIGINPEWIRTGEGEMEFEDKNEANTTSFEAKDNGYLLEYLQRIEDSFKTTVLEKDKVIEDQRFVINMLKTQLTSVLGKFDVSEETSPADAEKGREVEFIPEKEEPKKQAA